MAEAAFNEDEENVNLYTNVPTREAEEGETLHYMSTEAMEAYGGTEGKTTIAGPGGQFGEIDTPKKAAATPTAPDAAKAGKVSVAGQDREVTPQMIEEMLRKKAMQEHEVDINAPPEPQAEQRIMKKIPQLFQETFQRPMQPNEVMTIDPKDLKKFQGVLKDALKKEVDNIKWVQTKYENTRKNYVDFLFKDVKQELDQLKTYLQFGKEARAAGAPSSEMGKMLIDKFGKEAYDRMKPEEKQAEYEKLISGKEGAKIGLSQTGELNKGALEGLPQGAQNIVKQLVDYKIPLPSGFALRSPYWQKILGAAVEYDPTFDASQYNVRLKLRQDFTSGKAAQNIRSLNTVVGHLDTLKKKATALNNSPITLWNKIANIGITQTGDKRVIGFLEAATAVANELSTVFKGTGATDQEIKAWRSSIDASQSPEQLSEAINTAIELLGSRLGILADQYERGMGKPKDFHLLSAKSQKILKGLGADIGNLDPAAAKPAEKAPNAPSSNEPEYKESITPKTTIAEIAKHFTEGGMDRAGALEAAKDLKRQSIYGAIKQKNPDATDKEINDYIDKKYPDVKME